MAFEFLTNVPLEQALNEYKKLLSQNGFGCAQEKIPVTESCGRITSHAVYAHICAPHYHASAMDGIALRAKDTFGATETTPVRLTKEQFVVVDTGDLMPEDCDAVVMIEDVVWEDDGSVRLYDAAAPWQHIRQIGEDICAGEMILASYQKITPSAIGAMIAGGVLEVDVCTQPVVGIIPTGDEIVSPVTDPAPGDILEFNGSIFSAMLKEWSAVPVLYPIVKDKFPTGDEIVSPVTDPAPGDILEFNGSIFSAMLKEWSAVPVLYPIVKDKFNDIKAMVEKALSQCDIVLLNAGSSAGREDFSSKVIGELGTVLYHGIAAKPGKPAILGYQGKKPILGVPGYPVSGIIVIEEILKPLLEQWNHTAADSPVYEEARLSRAVISGLKYKEFVRVRLGYVNGELIASPLSRGSGVISSFMKADGILEIPQGSASERGFFRRQRGFQFQSHWRTGNCPLSRNRSQTRQARHFGISGQKTDSGRSRLSGFRNHRD